ncbi:hypothetical protein D0962_24580 [Leptolyngbyaceae cyanobacterium CCMR0082]|uniref:Uncharacterized protein n=2 Tax=Adonisia turfae TaxID=2950184 RepID=A0A6M0SBL7_9CYAN|nr:hypothetical protein [Adonisia turfae]MDV3352734.1 hypothetical protein [Leptothoe sp. LEGE 181152]NEZ57018.1 hypothetical protein [Adonisia turfae CCMR0081]NEZ65898.1 hypothetical protein [Adonisia turfae CCMR0082]
MNEPSDKAMNPADSNEQQENAETDENNVVQLVDQLIRAKRITYTQYQSLSKMVLADGTVDEQERRQINRLFDAIQAGGIRIVE